MEIILKQILILLTIYIGCSGIADIFISQLWHLKLYKAFMIHSLQMVPNNNNASLTNKYQRLNYQLEKIIMKKKQKYPLTYIEAKGNDFGILEIEKYKEKLLLYYSVKDLIEFGDSSKNQSMVNKMLNYTKSHGLYYSQFSFLNIFFSQNDKIENYKKFIELESKQKTILIIIDGINLLNQKDLLEIIKLNLILSDKNIYIILVSYDKSTRKNLNKIYHDHYLNSFEQLIDLVKHHNPKKIKQKTKKNKK